ncbi:aminotransferase class V-fold PLP-dependent enzyme [uncultured Castellaniella sp.]|uniref:aminotransferase class V-fold PLP-dependent enzyme n=1 Tax=uncultured Castellaniella sp. TaxID=647907 RepID=UPI00261254F0|nr:aminotransferase class V-fold PLP-dependent enzyme [uncultured Castellaniella sp.]
MPSFQDQFFSECLASEIKSRFHQVDHDHAGQKRLYFDNAGGAFRLKSVLDRMVELDAIPDNIERVHTVARHLQDVQARGEADFRCMLNAKGGSIHASQTASSVMFDMVRAISENVPGTNMVTTVLEHPSAFDAMSLYAQRSGKELRVAGSNPHTGGIDVDEIVRLVDQDTCVLNVICASNISGAKLDLEAIVQRARAIKPDLYILVDAVQHAPHGLIDLQRTPVDGINIAPYKFFGARGSGVAWLSDRAAVLPHHKLHGKDAGFWGLGSGTPWQFAAMTEIVSYVCWLGERFTDSRDRRDLFASGMTRIELQERALLSRLLDGGGSVRGLRHIPGVTVYLDYPDLSKRDLIVMIGMGDHDSSQVVLEYERRGVVVYQRTAGSIYSKRMLDSFNISGGVRISPLHVHTPEDIDRFLQVTAEMAGALA